MSTAGEQTSFVKQLNYLAFGNKSHLNTFVSSLLASCKFSNLIYQHYRMNSVIPSTVEFQERTGRATSSVVAHRQDTSVIIRS